MEWFSEHSGWIGSPIQNALCYLTPLNNDCTVMYCSNCIPTGAEALQNAAFGRGSFSQPILLDDLSCTGIETRLVDCDHNGINIHNCFHGEDASVRCMLPPGMTIH